MTHHAQQLEVAAPRSEQGTIECLAVHAPPVLLLAMAHLPACYAQRRRAVPAHYSTPAAFSQTIAEGLFDIRMIDGEGNVIEDPRWVGGCPWVWW